MHGESFRALLLRLGYRDVREASAYEWLFEQNETRALLAWMCENLRPANVLSAELAKRRSHAGDRQSRESAGYCEVDPAADDGTDPEALREEVAALQRRLTSTTAAIERLARQRDTLGVMQVQQGQRSEAKAALVRSLREDLDRSTEDAQHAASQRDGACTQAQRSVESAREMCEGGGASGAFLSRSDPSPYFDAEREYTECLQQYMDTLRSVCNGSWEGHDAEGSTRPSPADAAGALVGGVASDTRAQYEQELCRLAAAHVQVEGERAAVAAELARVKAEAATLHQVLKSMKGGVRRDDSSFTLGRQLKEEEQSARAHRQQAQHTRALLHEGLERSAAVHAKEIADVDAAARMTRLAYIASAQDKVLAGATRQLARFEFASMCLDNERSAHAQTRGMCGDLEEKVRLQNEAHARRQALGSQSVVRAGVANAVSGGAEDSLMRSVQAVLGGSSGQYDMMVQSARKLSDSCAAVASDLERLHAADADSIARLSSAVGQLHQQLYGGASTAQAVVAPHAVRELMSEVEQRVGVLARTLDVVLHNHAAKSKEVMESPVAQSQRELFEAFFTGPLQSDLAAE